MNAAATTVERDCPPRSRPEAGAPGARGVESVCVGVAAVALALLLVGAMLAARGRCVQLSEYVTSLEGRTDSQRQNAILAARRIDGATLEPGAEFSFNACVGPWTADAGYLRAPVSYDGELLVAWGGGVCQTSTTLYNAALLAGLQIRQRHAHEWPPRYAPPGRDAAVAFPGVDLILRNPYPWPVHLEAGASAMTLRVSVQGPRRPVQRATVASDLLAVERPATVSLPPRRGGRQRVLNPGQTGFEVAVYRTFTGGGLAPRRELISTDHYRPMNRLVRPGAEAAQSPAD